MLKNKPKKIKIKKTRELYDNIQKFLLVKKVMG